MALRIGMVGAGFLGKFQSIAMKQVRNMELAGVTSLKGAEDLSQFAQENDLGPATVYSNVTELAKNVDAVAVYCPNYARVEVVEEIVSAVKAGAQLKGVICEIPLGRNVAEARKMFPKLRVGLVIVQDFFDDPRVPLGAAWDAVKLAYSALFEGSIGNPRQVPVQALSFISRNAP